LISISDIYNANILIVDDIEANVLLLERMLKSAGYLSVKSTMNPCEVCGLHIKNRFDLIILDLQMPVMDGFQVMEELTKLESSGYLPVLVITAQPDHKMRALKAGAKDFITKPFDLAEVLLRVYNMLEVRLLHRETTRLYDRVSAEQQESERLLRNVLPHAIAERLKERSVVIVDRRSRQRTAIPWLGESFVEVIADSFANVTVLFADIVGFTKFSETVTAKVLVGVLNNVFTRFDSIADKRGLEKIKTIGDAYMAVAGLPVPTADHLERALNMALDMMEALDRFNEHSKYNLEVRIGLDTGPVVAGVIGRRKFLYDLWGDVVNTASRMESNGLPGRIQVSDSTRQQADELFIFEKRGIVDIKGKGEMLTWFLNGRSS